MVIDVHAHVNAPPAFYGLQARLISSGGAHGRRSADVADADIEECARSTVAKMNQFGTDVQLISPRPFSLMHSAEPAKIVHWWAQANNDHIAQQVAVCPDRLAGIAGLPQAAGTAVESWLPELDRAVNELGMVGCLLNPDPSEGRGQSPVLGDRYWYPLYERLVELDVPALIHSAACHSGRESYSEHFITEETIAILSLLNSTVFDDFPGLNLIVSHGGGSVPYQIGRWRAARLHPVLSGGHQSSERFDDSLRRLYFDTILHHVPSLELLIKTVGADRCLFGTENPGSGSVWDPVEERQLDDLRPVIEGFDWLSEAERSAILEGNARSLFALEQMDGAAARATAKAQ